MKTKYIVGNWKMNPGKLEDAKKILRGIERKVPKSKKVTAIICPPFVYIQPLKKSSKKVFVGAQNVFSETTGAFTGEVSIDMLQDLGVSHLIVGHSERRKLGESDELINKKIKLALKFGITPIFCIGETTRDDEGQYLGVIREQLEKGLVGVTKTDLESMIIAYEPVWAIGATQAMNAHDVHQMTIFIKKTLTELYKMKTRIGLPVLYGGSVDPTNAHAILTEGEADGLLIGRQSLEAKSFLEIIDYALNS
jgi:triosephosphate isomerase